MAKEEVKFEEKLEKLESIVKELEEGNVDLDDAINKYTEAMKIAKECSVKLDSATKAVNKILSENGELEEFKEMEVKE
ncbi:MAG: exodeoxyribonuclease VII small subunit [Bacilli bacterium]|nr:exodeoxyribonuclease VII small subunit [Bacilli bacterium]